MKLDNRGPVQISAHLTEVLPGVANWLLQKGVLQVNFFLCTIMKSNGNIFVQNSSLQTSR